MQLGMIGLGRMGANMVQRLMDAGHECVVYDTDPAAVAALTGDGAVGAGDLAELCARLARPRAIWIMVPAAVVGKVLDELLEGRSPNMSLIKTNFTQALPAPPNVIIIFGAGGALRGAS